MCVSSCEHPIKIYCRHSGDYMYVPCGECDICRANKSNEWCSRLEVERLSHPYCFFLTLTYSNDFLPVLTKSYDRLIDMTQGDTSLVIHENELPYDINYDSFYRYHCGIPYLRFSDAQKFIKRLRQRILRNPSKERVEDRYIRYYLVGELGETCFRPHFHALIFTSSKWFAEHAEDVVRQTWRTDNRSSDSKQLGIIDCQSVKYSASAYVASYLNCNSNIPRFFRHPRLRPRAIFSKCPPLGSLLSSTKEIQTLLDNESPTISVYRPGNAEYIETPMPKQLCNRLYPKVPGFARFSHDVLSAVYGLAPFVKGYDFDDFKEFIRKRYEDSVSGLAIYCAHLDELNDNSISESPMHQLFTCLRRIAFQCDNFKLTPQKYFEKICRFYSNYDMLNLTTQLQDEVVLSESCGCGACLLVDRVMLDEIKRYGATPLQIQILNSYGYDEEVLSVSDFIYLVETAIDPAYVDKLSKARKLISDYRKKRAKFDYLLQKQMDEDLRDLLIKIHCIDGIFENYE